MATTTEQKLTKPRAQREREAAAAKAEKPAPTPPADPAPTPAATVPPVVLHDFEGRTVKRASIKFRNTGTDLSNPLSVAPVELHHGDEGYALVKWTLDDVAHPAIKEKGEHTGDLQRVHTLRIDVVTLVDDEFGAEKIAQQRRKVEEMRGVLSLDLDGDAEED